MIAKEVDYQWHYDEFVRRHVSDRSLRMARYCDEAGIRRQRMYEWMTRRGLSLKRIYADAVQAQPEVKADAPGPSSPFSPLHVSPAPALLQSGPGLGRIRITLPNGVGIEIGQCSVNDLMVLTGGPLGSGSV